MILHKFAQHSSFVAFRPNLSNIAKCAHPSRGMPADARSDLREIFRRAVRAVSPREIVRGRVKFRGHALHVDERAFPLRGNVYLVGFGKAVMGMAVALEEMLGGVLKRGVVSVPRGAVWSSEGRSDFPKLRDGVVSYREGGAGNQPDGGSLDATRDIVDLVEGLTEADTLLVLVSGGGSALLCMPRPVLDRDDKFELCRRLQSAGADIAELNTVRAKLSLVKGGGLARMAYPASVVALILSDVVGDPIDLIASGPTVYSAKAPEPVVSVLKKYDLYRSLEGDLKTVVTSRETFDDSGLLTPAKQFKHVTNVVVGNNATAMEAASAEAARKKLTPITLRNDVTGNVRDVSLAYAHVTSLICLALSNELGREEFHEGVRTAPILPLSIDKADRIFDAVVGSTGGVVLIGGGEPTVVVTGRGKGGRNQELALRFSLDWLARVKREPRLAEYDVTMLSGGTDGQDGPTDAAGAFGYPAIAPGVRDLYARVRAMAAEEAQIGQKLKPTDRSANPREHDFNEAAEKSVPGRGNISERNDCLALTVMEVERMLPENALRENDTYNFYSRFKKGADLVKTGLTGTNVMDLHLIYIKKRSCKCEPGVSDEPIREENIFDAHDLRIDPSTAERYKALRATLKFDGEKFLETKEEKRYLDIKIIDENLADPCCNKGRKLD
ncbi:glycerate kinase isoform X2 [Ooceraea biroi]|uniref:glycerate kinase isoform X2 n=1 Tax=Ooceraea biroi TaxID=2015173 RepID=UPI0005BCD0C3|nr:glycerate kinase isoform X2 [Ooceraea biroi]